MTKNFIFLNFFILFLFLFLFLLKKNKNEEYCVIYINRYNYDENLMKFLNSYDNNFNVTEKINHYKEYKNIITEIPECILFDDIEIKKKKIIFFPKSLSLITKNIISEKNIMLLKIFFDKIDELNICELFIDDKKNINEITDFISSLVYNVCVIKVMFFEYLKIFEDDLQQQQQQQFSYQFDIKENIKEKVFNNTIITNIKKQQNKITLVFDKIKNILYNPENFIFDIENNKFKTFIDKTSGTLKKVKKYIKNNEFKYYEIKKKIIKFSNETDIEETFINFEKKINKIKNKYMNNYFDTTYNKKNWDVTIEGYKSYTGISETDGHYLYLSIFEIKSWLYLIRDIFLWLFLGIQVKTGTKTCIYRFPFLPDSDCKAHYPKLAKMNENFFWYPGFDPYNPNCIGYNTTLIILKGYIRIIASEGLYFLIKNFKILYFLEYLLPYGFDTTLPPNMLYCVLKNSFQFILYFIIYLWFSIFFIIIFGSLFLTFLLDVSINGICTYKNKMILKRQTLKKNIEKKIQ